VAQERPNVRKIVYYETVGAEDQPGVDYDYSGRVDLHAIRDVAVLPDADYYLCGPLPFMDEQRRALSELGVPPQRIHAEVFGTGGPGA
jgi:nitric oxide dioxygenase